MKLQQLGGGRRERGGWWSATNISVTWACVQNAPYVQMCAYVLGKEGSLHRAFADVTLLNNHSASIRQAENGALSIRQPKDTQLIHFFPPVWCGEACSESQNWSRACEVLYHAEWILTDEILCCLLKWHFVILPGMKRLLTHNTKTVFLFVVSCLSPDSSKPWPFNYDWLILDILTLENAKSVLHELYFFISDN